MADPVRPQDEARLAAIRAALEELRDEYAASLPALVSDLTGAGEAACASGDETQLRHLQTLAHRMHGAAGSYGFKSISVAAAKLEQMLTDRDKPGAPNRATLLAGVRAALLEIRATTDRELADHAALK